MFFVLLDQGLDGSSFMVLESAYLMAWNIPFPDSAFILSLKESIVQCYQVNAKYKEAKVVKGIRAAVYKYAEEHQAYYSQDRSKSIWYADDSTDLHVALRFEEKSKACDFRCFLGTWHQRNPLVVKSGVVTVEEEIKESLC